MIKTKLNKTQVWLLALCAGVIFCASCNDSDKENAAGNTYLSVRMSDTTADYDSVVIDVQSVEVKAGSGSTILLNANPGLYNLLDFTNGKDTLIASASIPSGRVSQIRLILGTNNYVVINGVRHDMSTPSAQQSGLKLNVQADLVAGIDYILHLDFDAGRSIVTTGNGNYILKPVIRVVSLAGAGSITGMVNPTAALPALATAYNATDTLSSFTDSTGHFLIHGVPTGSYTVMIEPQLPYAPDTFYNISVAVGNLTDIGLINF
jgi:hypothetical protein